MRHQILLLKYDIIGEFGETRLVAQSCTKLAQDCAKVVKMKIQKFSQKFEEEQKKRSSPKFGHEKPACSRFNALITDCVTLAARTFTAPYFGTSAAP